MSDFKPNLTNLLQAVKDPATCGFEVAWHAGRVGGYPQIRLNGETRWLRADTGHGLTLARLSLEGHGFRTPAKGITADVLRYVALEKGAEHG